ncbi:MAG TPA: hypothetical protein VGR22_10850 [Thermomicrobiales bacterium]|nr:hypothetical protein [Thermomicrobiales bacterium]
MTEQTTESTLTAAERTLVALFFIVVIVVSVIVVGRLGTEPTTVIGPVEERPAVDAEVPRPVPVRDTVDIASDWAEEWDDEAWPILVSAQFSYPPDPGNATPVADEGTVLVTFAAPKEDGEWPRLTLAVGRQSGVIYHEDEITSTVEPPEPIGNLIADLPISAEQAFRVAQEVVGEEYRSGCELSRRHVQVVLDTTDREEPHWVVVYYDERERTTNDIVVRIDAQTGATETEIRDDLSC